MKKRIAGGLFVLFAFSCGLFAQASALASEVNAKDAKLENSNAELSENAKEESELLAREESLRYKFIFSIITHGFCREENYAKFTKDFDANKFRFFWYKSVDFPLKLNNTKNLDSMNVGELKDFDGRRAWILRYPLPMALGHPLYAIVVEDGKKGRYFTLNLASDEFLGEPEKLLKSSAGVYECVFENGKFEQKNMNKSISLDDATALIKFIKTVFETSEKKKD